MINFDDFYTTKFQKFRRYAISLVSKIDVAEDITQESFIKLHENQHLISSGKFDSWLHSVIKNKSIDYYRTAYKKREFLYEDGLSNDVYNKIFSQSDDGRDILDVLLSINEEDKIKSDYNKAMCCINKLPPSYKIVFNMFVIENKSHKEIAKELGIVEGTSKSNYYKAKKSLRKMLKDV